MKLGVRGPIPGRTLREKAEVLKRTNKVYGRFGKL